MASLVQGWMCQARFSLPTGSAALGPVHSAVAQLRAHHVLLLAGHGEQHYHQARHGHGHGLAPLHHHLLKLLTLGWSERVPHGQAVINRGFFQRELGGADFLQLAIDRRAVWLVGREKVIANPSA